MLRAVGFYTFFSLCELCAKVPVVNGVGAFGEYLDCRQLSILVQGLWRKNGMNVGPCFV